LLDALETAVREYPKAEGCFAQVSGMTFTFDPSVPSGVVLDSNGTFLRVDGPRRVSNVMVGGKPLELQQHYTIASNDYVLLKGGDAISFRHAQLLETVRVSDLQALENYLLNNLHGIIAEPYDRPQGRILIQSHDKRERTGVRPTSKIKINRLASTDPDDEFYDVKAEDFQKSRDQKSGNKPTVAPR
jgi:hypothetical protein